MTFMNCIFIFHLFFLAKETSRLKQKRNEKVVAEIIWNDGKTSPSTITPEFKDSKMVDDIKPNKNKRAIESQ